MLHFNNVSHHYGPTPSVYNIELELKKGRVASLLGPSGCGKSTLLRIAAGLEAPREGAVFIDGAKVADADGMFVPPEKRRVGLVFQDYALFPHMSVARNIAYGLDHMSNGEKQQRLDEVLKQVDLTDYADAMPHQLSGGEQQRVALARALAPRPKLMLLDEPYASLDSRLRENIRDDMLHVLREAGTTVLLVTHDSEEAMFMSDEIHVMEAGRIIQSGRPIDLYCRPQSAFVAEFFGEVNRVDGPVVNGKLQTPFGEFDANTNSDRAALVIRHEGLQIGPNGGRPRAPRAEVMETRLLGRYSLVHLSMPTGSNSGEELHLHARVPGLNMLEQGETVTLSVDRAQVFVFSA